MGRLPEPYCPTCAAIPRRTAWPVRRLYIRVKDKGFVPSGWRCDAGHSFNDDDALQPNQMDPGAEAAHLLPR